MEIVIIVLLILNLSLTSAIARLLAKLLCEIGRIMKDEA